MPATVRVLVGEEWMRQRWRCDSACGKRIRQQRRRRRTAWPAAWSSPQTAVVVRARNVRSEWPFAGRSTIFSFWFFF